MRSIFTLLLVLFASGVPAQIVNIPDANFKNALLNNDPVIDTNGDNEIQVSEAEDYTNDLFILNENISDLTGIEAFVNITRFAAGFNPITNVDLSANVNLEFLNLYQTQLSSIDLSANVNLKNLSIGQNNISNLNLSANTQLESLTLDNMPLVDLNIGQSSNLLSLVVQLVPLANLDVTGNPNLESLFFINTMVSSIDLSNNINLVTLGCQRNQLTQLDLSQNTNLITVVCSFQNITSIDVSNSPNLEDLKMGYNELTTLDLSQNPNIRDLTCHFNNLTELDLSNQTSLERMLCYDNPMTFLDVKSGQNNLLSEFQAQNIPNLCIQVDNEDDANNGVGSYGAWMKDATAIYAEDCSLGVDSTSLNATFEVVPNPTDGRIQINSKLQHQVKLMELFDLQGRKIQTWPATLEIDLSSHRNGIYLLNFHIGAQIVTKKVVKM